MRSLLAVGPILLMSLGSVTLLLGGLWIRSALFQVGLALSTVLLSLLFYLQLAGGHSQDLFSGMLAFDPFGNFFALFFLVVLAAGIVFSSRSREILEDRRAEYYSILLAMGTGLILMASSNHFLMAYLALETVSILSYCLAGFHRERDESVEASLKYVVYGSLASAIMIFGLSLIFGATGQFTITGLRVYFAHTAIEQVPSILWIAVLLTFAGIGYKVSAAPMHMWTPDVYEGAPTPVSAILSVAPKAAGLALLIRFFVVGFTYPVEGDTVLALSKDPSAIGYHIVGPFNWPQFLLISSVFTMFMGNLAALAQTSVKRILAYSSIAHAGYMLMGITTQTSAGIAAILYYLVIYCFMNVGAFWVASKVEDTLGGDHLRQFRGLARQRPFWAIAMGVFLFSLVGLPPLAGFVGKYYLFMAAIAREMYGLVIFAAINSVISLYYYAKIARAMFLDAPEVPFPAGRTPFESMSSKVCVGLLVVPNLILGIYWEPIYNLILKSLEFLPKA
jgi:NADH-quinone oxidoreductase subunit N